MKDILQQQQQQKNRMKHKDIKLIKDILYQRHLSIATDTLIHIF